MVPATNATGPESSDGTCVARLDASGPTSVSTPPASTMSLCKILEGRCMKKRFKLHDRVSWNSEAGRVSGRIVKVHTKDVNYKGYVHQIGRASCRERV